MRTRSLLTMVLLAAGVTACSQPLAWRPAPGPDGYVHTLANLHPTEGGNSGRLDSANYQSPGLIPVCTAVIIERFTNRAAVFTVATNGRRYTYRIDSRLLGEPIEYHLARYFGSDCERGALATLGAADQQGIRDGRVYAGMTKRGVIFALGWPPPGGTPSTDADVWRYWRDASDTFEIYFQGGQVTYVRE